MSTMSISHFQNDITYATDGIVSKKILKHKHGNVTLFAFAEGQELSAHTSPYEALVQVLEGQAEITIDEVSWQLTAGYSIILPPDIPHAVRAVTQFKMLLTMIRPEG